MDKLRTLDDLVERARDVGSLSFGGGGLVRKPMSAAAAIGMSDISPKSVKALLGGAEVDLLIGTGKVRDLHFAFIGMDSVGLAPNFRKARESGGLPIVEGSEYLVLAALEASARGVSFLPTKSGLGTDLLTRPNSPYKVFDCPITGEKLVAAPAIRPDLAVIHVNIADRRGNAVVYGEIFADYLLARAAAAVWVTAETVVDELPPMDRRPHGTFISRLFVEGVIESHGGADFTGIYPEYPVDIASAEAYRDNAADESWLRDYASALVQRSSVGVGA